jgi:hypothetical protein
MAQDAEARQLREIAEALHKARQWDDLFAGPSDWTQVIPGSRESAKSLGLTRSRVAHW